MTSVILDVKVGEYLSLQGGIVTVQLVHKSGNLMRLRVTAPSQVAIELKESARESDDFHVPSMAICG